MSKSQPDADPQADAPPAKKKRGCLSRLILLLLVFIAILAGVLVWLNGPGYRWLAHKYGPEFLAEKGFQADFQLSGTLWNGPTIERLSLSSETSPLKSLTAENLRLRYNVFELRDLKIDAITADTLTLDLDLAQSAPKEEQEEKEPTSTEAISEQLAKYRQIATHPEISIAALNVHVHKGEENYYKLTEGSFAHAQDSADFELDTGTVTDFENKDFTSPPTKLAWGEETFALTNLPLIKECAASDLIFKIDPLFLEGHLNAFDSQFTFKTDLTGNIEAELGEQAFDLTPFLALSQSTEKASGKMTEFKADIVRLDQEFSQWAVEITLTLEDKIYQNRVLPPTTFTVSKNDLELETTLTIEIPEHPQTFYLLTEFDPKTAQSAATAWENSSSSLTTELSSLSGFFKGVAPALHLPVPPDGWPDGETLLLASLNIQDAELSNSSASLSFNRINWGSSTFEKGELVIDFVDWDSDLKATLDIEQSPTSTLTSRASFNPESQDYAATFSANNFDAQAIQPFINLSIGELPLAGTITLDWQGTGSLADIESNRGKLALTQTRLSIDQQSPIQFNLEGEYEGLNQVDLSHLGLKQGDQQLSLSANWNGERVNVPKLSLVKEEQELATGSLSVPYSLGTDPKQYFSIQKPIAIDLKATELNIPETADLLGIPIPEGLGGILSLDVNIAGSPAVPTLGGKVLVEDFVHADIPQLPPTSVRLAWATAGETLTLDGTLEPDGRNPIVIAATTAFHPNKWAEDPESILDETFTAEANATRIQLAPFAELSPLVRSLNGELLVQVKADGTFRSPKLTGNIDLDLPKARFNIERLRRVRQTKLKAEFDGQVVRIAPFSTSIDGALFDLNGAINIADLENPAFDLKLVIDKALLWRDDNINARADAAVTLKGTLNQAALTGGIDLRESLFYKDIELLPINVPVSTPKAPTLPSLSKKPKSATGSSSAVPVPEPFSNWTLNIKAATADPFLIRGNLTKGEVVGGLTATGTLANPVLNGELSINELTAALPFSSLKIDGGKVQFSPKNGFIPTLDIRAESRIPPYEVDLFVAGSATSPSLVFTSNPPLPENEVITLLATGTTPAGLEDSDSAQSKALQLLIEQVRRAPPGTLLHPLAKAVEPLKDVEIQAGGSDPFTGKPRNSLTLPLSDRFFFSAAVDSESNTRGLVLYLLKFR